MPDLRFRYYKNFRSIPADESNINEQVPLDSGTYDIKRNETKMENYKNFFSDSYVDEVFMEGNNVHMHKKYGDNIVFKFIDMGWKKEVLESIKESIQIEAFPEIIFLSKYVGDYNITKFGDKLVFENNGHCVVLKRDEIIYKLYTYRIHQKPNCHTNGHRQQAIIRTSKQSDQIV